MEEDKLGDCYVRKLETYGENENEGKLLKIVTEVVTHMSVAVCLIHPYYNLRKEKISVSFSFLLT